MALAETIQRTWSQFLSSGTYEQDPGFRDVILRLCRRGMLVTGVLTVVCVLANVAAYVAVGNTLAIVPDDPETSIFLWDRLIILILGAIYLILGNTRSGRRFGRIVGAIFVLVAGVSILVDDIVQGGEVYYSDRYLGVAMLLVIALIPYRPRQALVYVVGIWGLYLISYWYLPGMLGIAERPLSPGVLVYILIVGFFCLGLSFLLYNSRYEQYRVRRDAELLREQIEHQAGRLVEMEQLKSRFFTNISHEFRTPLTLILGPVDDALEERYGPVGAALRKQLHVMRRSGRRLQGLINQLLDLSKLEAGRMTVRVRADDLVSFARVLVGSFSSLAERNGITLQFEAEIENLTLSFDADKIEKIFANLLSNAFKFTPAEGAIRVAVRASQDETGAFAEIAVRDTGPGIPPEEVPHVFDRFHQVGHASGQEHAGTGIGLALVKELVELHGGDIRVESEPEFGSEFVVRLPLDEISAGVDGREIEEDERAEMVESGMETEQVLEAGEELDVHDVEEVTEDWEVNEAGVVTDTPTDAPTILIVEDNADVRGYLRSHLAASYCVLEATDGEDGLSKARDAMPDLVISDVMMPKMDGVALCRALKADEQLNHIPVILVTARSDEESKMEGLKTGADDYLTKPFNADELVTRVENLIEIRRVLRHRFSGEVIIGPSEIAVRSAEAEFVERVRLAVEQHVTDSDFGVEWLADEVGMSVRNLRRRLRAATGLSPGGYIRMMRLERAKQLLSQRAGTVSEIAFQVGFRDPDHFSKLFKQTVGVPPSEYGANRP